MQAKEKFRKLAVDTTTMYNISTYRIQYTGVESPIPTQTILNRITNGSSLKNTVPIMKIAQAKLIPYTNPLVKRVMRILYFGLAEKSKKTVVKMRRVS